MHRLFRDFAHRYDLHTPPGHYKHDHALVIAQAKEAASEGCRLLDVGCGTGVFIEAALAAGIDAYGVDCAPEMIEVANQRLGAGRARVGRMQDITDITRFDLICALSWTIHYCETQAELEDVIGRCHRALLPGGRLVLQVANSDRMTGAVNIDYEPGPAGEPNDTVFIHRFEPLSGDERSFRANYVYASHACGDLLSEQHLLRFASLEIISAALSISQFQNIRIVDESSISPFIVGDVI
jgi:SAM-dependent methyltransferase